MLDRTVPALPLFIGSMLLLAAQGLAAGASSELAELCEKYWQGYLEAYPTAATSLGDPRYDDRLEDISPAGIAKETRRLESAVERARRIAEAGLSPKDRLTRTALIIEIEGELARLACGFHKWTVDPLGGPQVELMSLSDYTIIETPKDAAKYVKRMQAGARYLDDHIANLKSGLAEGKAASRDAVLKTIEQLQRLGKTQTESLAAWKPATV